MLKSVSIHHSLAIYMQDTSCIVNVPKEGSARVSPAKAAVYSVKFVRLRRPPCVDLQVCLDSQRLYALHDGTFQTMQQTQRNILQQMDLETQKTIMTAHEFSEHFELVCFAPGKGGQGGHWCNELYAGAVHGSELHVRHPRRELMQRRNSVAKAPLLCRLLHALLPRKDTIPLLPQGQVCHSCAVCVRPARPDEHGKPSLLFAYMGALLMPLQS